jgi:hypothetical protein
MSNKPINEQGKTHFPVTAGGKTGIATLSVIPENEEQEAPKLDHAVSNEESEPAPVVAPLPSPPKQFNVRVYVQSGWVDEKADTLDAAKARAEFLAKNGIWQQVGNQWTLHKPADMRIVVS